MPKTHRRVQQNIPNIKITQDGVAKLMKNIHPSKASSPDNIPNRVLKQCSDHLAPALTIIFQCSIDHGKLSNDWLNANVSCIFKKGDKHAAENYRPVLLTSVTMQATRTHNMRTHDETSREAQRLNITKPWVQVGLLLRNATCRTLPYTTCCNHSTKGNK
jgi:hypothetical protein